MQVVLDILRGNRGKMSTKAPAFLLSRSPEQLLLAPEVTLAILLLPRIGAVRGAIVVLTPLSLDWGSWDLGTLN